MPKKRRRVLSPKPVTRAQFIALRRDVDRLLAVAGDLESIRKDCAANLRRCAELQHEIDRLKHLVTPHS